MLVYSWKFLIVCAEDRHIEILLVVGRITKWRGYKIFKLFLIFVNFCNKGKVEFGQATAKTL